VREAIRAKPQSSRRGAPAAQLGGRSRRRKRADDGSSTRRQGFKEAFQQVARCGCSALSAPDRFRAARAAGDAEPAVNEIPYPATWRFSCMGPHHGRPPLRCRPRCAGAERPTCRRWWPGEWTGTMNLDRAAMRKPISACSAQGGCAPSERQLQGSPGTKNLHLGPLEHYLAPIHSPACRPHRGLAGRLKGVSLSWCRNSWSTAGGGTVLWAPRNGWCAARRHKGHPGNCHLRD